MAAQPRNSTAEPLASGHLLHGLEFHQVRGAQVVYGRWAAQTSEPFYRSLAPCHLIPPLYLEAQPRNPWPPATCYTAPSFGRCAERKWLFGRWVVQAGGTRLAFRAGNPWCGGSGVSAAPGGIAIGWLVAEHDLGTEGLRAFVTRPVYAFGARSAGGLYVVGGRCYSQTFASALRVFTRVPHPV